SELIARLTSATCTAWSATRTAASGVRSTPAANPQVPSCTTRTAKPTSSPSRVVSSRPSRNASACSRTRSNRTSACATPSCRALRRRGYPVRRHSARQVDPADLERYDLVVALDSDHARALRRMARAPGAAGKVRLLRSFDPAAGADLDVPDPYYGGQRTFDHV